MPDFLTDVDVDGNLTEQGQRVYSPNNPPPSAISFHKRSSTDTSNADPRLIIPWQTELDSSGTDITWSSANNTRLTINTTGIYMVGAVVTHSSPSQRAQAVLRLAINETYETTFRGTSYVRNSGDSWDYWALEMANEPFQMTAGDYFELDLRRVSGADATYGTGAAGTITHVGTESRFWVIRIG